MISLAQKQVEPIYRLSYDDLPEEVVAKVKDLIAHCLGSACVGVEETWTRAALETQKEMCAAGSSSLWFTSYKSSAMAAAYVNGVASQSSGQEDVHRESAAHGGIVIIPAAVSLADAVGADGRTLITALVAGYEFLCRIGRGGSDPEITRRGFRPTTVFGVFATCVAAGMLLKLTEEQMVSAIGIAGNYCCGVNEWAKAGTDDIFIQNGLCASAGILAAELAKHGLRGSPYIFEGSDGASGVCSAFGFAPSYLKQVKPFSGDFSVLDVVCKSSPSCLFTQTTARVAELAVKDGIRSGDITSGIIWTATKAKDYGYCNNPGPFLGLIQARNSHQYVAASAIIKGAISNACFTDYRNPEIAELARRLTVQSGPEQDAVYPEYQSGILELHLKNGQVKRYELPDARWLTEDEIWSLFESNLATRLPYEQIRKIRRSLEDLENLENVKDFTELLCWQS